MTIISPSVCDNSYAWMHVSSLPLTRVDIITHHTKYSILPWPLASKPIPDIPAQRRIAHQPNNSNSRPTVDCSKKHPVSNPSSGTNRVSSLNCTHEPTCLHFCQPTSTTFSCPPLSVHQTPRPSEASLQASENPTFTSSTRRLRVPSASYAILVHFH